MLSDGMVTALRDLFAGRTPPVCSPPTRAALERRGLLDGWQLTAHGARTVARYQLQAAEKRGDRKAPEYINARLAEIESECERSAGVDGADLFVVESREEEIHRELIGGNS